MDFVILLYLVCGISILKKPPVLTSEAIKVVLDSTPLKMTWQWKIDRKNWGQIIYEYKNKLGMLKLKIMPTPKDPDLNSAKDMGVVARPLVVCGGKPTQFSVKSLAKLIRDKKVVIYTGAGISAKSVPTMDQLLQDLGFYKVLSNPRQFQPTKHMMDNLNKFKDACLTAEPSLAHLCVRDICQKKNWGLMTENVDLLHQRTGVMPLNHRQVGWLKNQISLGDLKKIDVVLTVGLRTDESGFLRWYKQHNPKGDIVAINLTQPVYLSNQDYFVQGDAQEVCPLLYCHLKGEN